MTMGRKLVVGDIAIVESDLNYRRLTQYFPEPFEAPESRAQWVERM